MGIVENVPQPIDDLAMRQRSIRKHALDRS
jgi:hypothetical protein